MIFETDYLEDNKLFRHITDLKKKKTRGDWRSSCNTSFTLQI